MEGLIMNDFTKKANENIEKEFLKILRFVIKKNTDYSASSFSGNNLLVKNQARIEDKMRRCLNLFNNDDRKINDERLIDTLTDLCGYIVIRRILLKEEKNEDK